MIYQSKVVQVEAWQWNEGEPWVEGMKHAIGGPVVRTNSGPVYVASGDYIIKGDGEYYPCKPDVFEKRYEPFEIDYPPKNTNMTFSEALEALKADMLVARSGWNGKGMFLFVISTAIFQESLGVYGEYVNEPTPTAFIAIKTAQNTISPWQPSNGDMFANDWMILNGEG